MERPSQGTALAVAAWQRRGGRRGQSVRACTACGAPFSGDCRRLRRSCQHHRAEIQVQSAEITHISRRVKSEERGDTSAGLRGTMRTNYITGVYRCMGEYGGGSQGCMSDVLRAACT
ncbi:unnamed protein product [Ectocarpus sp. 8 AP-2014]